jgi:SET domain-containing protein
MHQSNLVRIKRVKGKGRGVFARQAIAKGTVIEKVPVMVIPNSAFVGAKANPFRRKIFFEWGESTVAMVLGYGPIYNHSYMPNACYEHGTMTMTYRALRDIADGEEITINYNFDPGDRSPVGFEVV